jgi:carboxypeptidase PM20D1
VDAEIHARGAIDDKGSLVAILEAVEQLAEGFAPAHDVYLSFGHNEETAGGGARAIVALLRERGVRPGLVIDEGGAVVDGVVPGERADRDGRCRRAGRHDGAAHRARERRARVHAARDACDRAARAGDRPLHRHPFPTRIAPRARTVRDDRPHAPQPLRWCSEPRLTGRSSPGVRAPGPRDERDGADDGRRDRAVRRAGRERARDDGARLDQHPPADRRHRGGAAARVRRVVGDPQVEIEVRHGSDPSPVSPWRGEPWRRIATAVRDGLGDDIVTTPYIQLGASDSRWFTEISDNVYRFTRST